MRVLKFFGNLLAGMVSLVYFSVLLAMASVLVVSNFLSADYYTKILSNIDFKEIRLSDLGVTGTDADLTVEDVLVDALGEAGISENDAKKIINSEKINEVAGELISDTANYFIDQKEMPQLDVNDVKAIMESEEASGLVDQVPSDMTPEEITNELNNFIKEALEGVDVNDQ